MVVFSVDGIDTIVQRSVGPVMNPILVFSFCVWESESIFWFVQTKWERGGAFWLFSARRTHASNHSAITIRLRHFGRDVFLGHRVFPALVDDGLGSGVLRLAGPGLVGGAVTGDARVGAVLSRGAHGCGEVVVGGLGRSCLVGG